MLRLFPVLSICCLILLSLTVGGCGYKDDLYLPDPDKPPTEKTNKNR